MPYPPKLRASMISAWEGLAHFIGRLTRRYFVEDFVRVYPGDLTFNRLGLRKEVTPFHRNNFLNHRKFYLFAGQFVSGKLVADIGCGSGYGSAMLKDLGARGVYGCDLSNHAIRFAQEKYGASAQFTRQNITALSLYPREYFDTVICSEVLEHVKEYGKEQVAIEEMKRVCKLDGLIVIGTPNSELLGDHGFSYEKILELLSANFEQFIIFENALVPDGPSRADWESRREPPRIFRRSPGLSQAAIDS
jgi:2-polyprenyl-3-methyl-5-hydroxy-6-metoxy-1,4-benzoquinol methylase